MSVCSCVKGSMPKVGEKVMVEASYNPNMPFKWNAVCVQVLAGPQVSVRFIELLAAKSLHPFTHKCCCCSEISLLIDIGTSANVKLVLSVDGDADAAMEARIRIGWNKFR